MKISAKTDYACQALLELAIHWPSTEPLQIQDIAKRRNIPIKFLTHILIQLKQLGFVQSTRGKLGGYILSKAPNSITLADVVKGFSEMQMTPHKPKKGRNNQDAIRMFLKEADEVLLSFMNHVTFEEIVKRSQGLEKVHMYSI